MAQLDIPDLISKIKAAEVALPGYCDKAIAAITAAEGNLIGNFILSHIGVTDPKAAEDELISALKTVKAIVGQGAAFIDPFLDMLLNLKPAPVTP